VVNSLLWKIWWKNFGDWNNNHQSFTTELVAWHSQRFIWIRKSCELNSLSASKSVLRYLLLRVTPTFQGNYRISGGGCTGSKCTPSQKNCAERSRYSNRAVTLIKQSHDHEAVHNRLLTNILSIFKTCWWKTAICDLFPLNLQGALPPFRLWIRV